LSICDAPRLRLLIGTVFISTLLVAGCRVVRTRIVAASVRERNSGAGNVVAGVPSGMNCIKVFLVKAKPWNRIVFVIDEGLAGAEIIPDGPPVVVVVKSLRVSGMNRRLVRKDWRHF
jgi:hypothetical protein